MGPTRVNRKLSFESGEEQIKGYGKVTQNTEIFSTKYGNNIIEVGSPDIRDLMVGIGVRLRHRENFWAFTGPRRDFGLILLILNMIIHRSFTGPTHLLSANVRGPVSFAVSADCCIMHYPVLHCLLFGWQ